MLCRGCSSVPLLLLPSPHCPRSCSSYLLPPLLHLSPTLTHHPGARESSYSLCRIKHTHIISDGCLSNLLLKIPQECHPKTSLFFRGLTTLLDRNSVLIDTLFCGLTTLLDRNIFFFSQVSNPVLPCGKLSQATIKMENN